MPSDIWQICGVDGLLCMRQGYVICCVGRSVDRVILVVDVVVVCWSMVVNGGQSWCFGGGAWTDQWD